jgi:hypothetical protein
VVSELNLKSEEADEQDEDEPEDLEEALDGQLKGQLTRMEMRRKKAEKKAALKKAKYRQRLDLNMEHRGDHLDVGEGDAYFRLKQVKVSARLISALTSLL